MITIDQHIERDCVRVINDRTSGFVNIYYGFSGLVEDQKQALGLAKSMKKHLEVKAKGGNPTVLDSNYSFRHEPSVDPPTIDRHDTPWLQLAEQKLNAAHFAKVLKNYATMLEQPWRYEVEPCYDLSAAFDFDAAPGGADFWLWVEKQIYEQ